MQQAYPKLLLILPLTPNLALADTKRCVELSVFEKVTPCSTLADVLAKVGEPSADIGSGLYIKEYKICGGGTVHAGAPSMDSLLYVNYESADGTTKKDLLAGKPDCPENGERRAR